MSTRVGKIARLPKSIREQLNERMDEGGQGPELLEWLNGLPEVKEMLARDFGGKEINGPNLTAWRQGGYADWVAQGQVLELAQRLDEEAIELKEQEKNTGKPLGELLLTLLTAKYVIAARQPMEGEAGWLRLRVLCADLERLRRMEHQERRMRIEEAKLEGQPRQRWQEASDVSCLAAGKSRMTFADRVRARLNQQVSVTSGNHPLVTSQATATQQIVPQPASSGTAADKAQLSQIKVPEESRNTHEECQKEGSTSAEALAPVINAKDP
ncbi:MAG TPA: hypothetical protein VHH73_12195 [Verrucomicrobiae bacterium]|nr:hypothetical protein [Verrucomicrobiae bacterium]